MKLKVVECHTAGNRFPKQARAAFIPLQVTAANDINTHPEAYSISWLFLCKLQRVTKPIKTCNRFPPSRSSPIPTNELKVQ